MPVLLTPEPALPRLDGLDGLIGSGSFGTGVSDTVDVLWLRSVIPILMGVEETSSSTVEAELSLDSPSSVVLFLESTLDAGDVERLSVRDLLLSEKYRRLQ